MRPRLDGQLNRLSLVIVTVVSVAATAVILTGVSGRTAAQRAALVALHQPAPGRTVDVLARPPQSTGAGSAASSSPGVVTGGRGTRGNGGASGLGGGAGAGAADSGGATGGAGAASPTGQASTGNGSTGTPSSGGGNGGGGGTSGGGPGGGAKGGSGTPKVPAGDAALPKVGHVFEIALSTTSYPAAFGHGAARYLDSLVRRGTLLSGYRSLGSSELADELASVSGQLPNPDTRGGCTTFAEFPTGVAADARGFVPGQGCVYPETALTIGDQVTASGRTWGAFVADQGRQACVHPNSNAVDDVALPFAQPGYEDRHNPFVYFHSLLDLGDCASDDLDLTKLPAALRSPAKTPRFTYIAPDACADARAIAPKGSGTAGATTPPGTTTTTTTTTSPTGTATTPTTGTTGTATTGPGTTGTGATGTGTGTTGTGATGRGTTGAIISGARGLPTAAACPSGPVGIAAEDVFLRTWVPRILGSAAYRHNGVLVIAFAGDGTRASGPGIRTGALILSRWTRPGATIAGSYSPYSLLRSVEDMLRYQRLAEAARAKSFAAAVLPKLH